MMYRAIIARELHILASRLDLYFKRIPSKDKMCTILCLKPNPCSFNLFIALSPYLSFKVGYNPIINKCLHQQQSILHGDTFYPAYKQR